MPSINELRESKFLTKDDVGPGALLTISGVERVNVARDNEAPEFQWCLHFNESPKPFIVKSTNGQIIAQFLNSEEMNDWRGRQIVLFHDPTIQFGGRVMGGIRARAPKIKTAPAPGQAMQNPPGTPAGYQAPASTPAPYVERNNPAPAAPSFAGDSPFHKALAPHLKPLPLAQEMENTDDIPF